MITPTATPYGAWPSPITATSLVDGAVGIGEVSRQPEADWWSESRPSEGGRVTVMRRGRTDDAEPVEITPPEANVRTRVHEYGGASWWVFDDALFWVDYGDQRLRRTSDGVTSFITTEPDRPAGDRYADGVVTNDGCFIVCVREHHGETGEPTNEIVAIATDESMVVKVLYDGADFVSSPRLSAQGDLLTFVSWNHPEMPWTRTRLHCVAFADGHVGDQRLFLEGDVAYCEPGFDGGQLLVVADRDEWWNLYSVDLESGQLDAIVGGSFEIATPPWVFGMQRWAVIGSPDGRGATIAVAGMPTGDELIVDGRTSSTIDTSITGLSAHGDGLLAVGAGYDHDAEVIEFTVTGGVPRRCVVRPARPLAFDRGLLVEPEWISFPSGPPGSSGGPTAHGLFYPPTNPRHVGLDGEQPPLLVLAHGGPTAQARRQMQAGILFWTSRGVAVVDVDYRGSTGYGRSYRQALDGQWGIADVEDAVAATSYLAGRGDVDPDRLMIRGGSAGGFTVLAALAFHDVFAAGASRYGVADLEALATDTHKFEARYLDSLVGPYPEARHSYLERSPIHHVDKLDAPMIVLQGDEDEIVPPNQSEMIVDALRAKGVEVEYLLFEGEQHGFRKAENIVTALEAELAFFGRILGFTPA
jgi:dipeptidyl aminopeptidase/acylaminoacyl peptidase